MKHRCDNCCKIWEFEQLKRVEDLSMRVELGGPMPSGECPDCGALCYPSDEGAMKLYDFVLHEQNGEQEYTYDLLIEAESWEKAHEIAERYARNFYGEGCADEEEDGSFGFYVGSGYVIVSIQNLTETTKGAWVKRRLESALVHV